MSTPSWPPLLANSPTWQALQRAVEENRLGHALIFVASDILQADQAAMTLSQILLQGSVPHADYMSAAPANKQRQIGVDAMRGVRDFLSKSSLSGVKVAHISQADRLNTAGANLFLKILEEPPANTTIIMTTSEPYAMLPTLVSRAMRFRFDMPGGGTPTDTFFAWGQQFAQLLQSPNSNSLLQRAGLTHQAFLLLQQVEEDTSARKISREDDTPKETLEALEAGRLKALKKEFYSTLQQVALNVYKENPTDSWRLQKALSQVERIYALTEFNLNTPAALEAATEAVASALVSKG